MTGLSTVDSALMHPPGSAAARWHRVYGELLRDVLTVRRNTPQIVEIIFWPTLELITWGCVSLFLQANKVPAVLGGLLGAVLLWQMLARPQSDLARTFLEDVWARNLLGVFVTPISLGEYLAGMVVSGVTRLAAGVGLLVVFASVLYGFGLWSLGPALVPYITVLLVMAWALGIASVALVIRFGASAATFAWLLAFAFQPFSAVFYPLSILPGPVQAVGHLVPASYVFENMREVLRGGSPSWTGLAVAGLLDLCYVGAALVWLHSALANARRTGRLSRFGE
jgi:ABC-2 type transport system permease protein